MSSPKPFLLPLWNQQNIRKQNVTTKYIPPVHIFIMMQYKHSSFDLEDPTIFLILCTMSDCGFRSPNFQPLLSNYTFFQISLTDTVAYCRSELYYGHLIISFLHSPCRIEHFPELTACFQNLTIKVTWAYISRENQNVHFWTLKQIMTWIFQHLD